MIPVEGREDAYWWIPRGAEGIKCSCGGYADRVYESFTKADYVDFGCGRDRPGFTCCVRAFVCSICNKRTVGKAEPPEME